MTQPPNLLQGPEPVETADLHFKLSCKLKIFETETKYEGGHCCVLAVSQYYGLIFVGNRTGFSVIKTKALGSVIDSEKFPKRDVVVNVRPTHLAVDFSQKILAVVCSSKPGSLLIFYEIQSFACKNIAPLKITPISKLSQNPAAEVVDLTWQPNADGSLMICMSDGSVLALSQGAKDGPVFTVPNTTQATCFCWSPKGKQIVIGSASGMLSQYKPDLKVVKTLPPPPIYNGAAMVVSVLWISSFQFAVAYNDRANPESFPVITIVNAAKNEPVSVINYDDITYSTTLFRNHQIYMTHQSAWNLIFVSSANSIEVAVLHSKDGSTWEQWLLGDASRAELPLNPDRQETFPLGWAFDFTSEEAIPWGEGSLPPMPRLLLMSDEGVLCVFNVVNATGNAPQLCTPPKENLDDSLFTSSNKTSPPANVEEPKPAVEAPESILGTPPTFGNVKSTFAFKTSPGFGGFGAPQLQPAMSQGASMTLQQQLEQQPTPQPQVSLTSPQQNQQLPQQPPVSSTQVPPSATPFSLSAPQFGFSFSFGGNSTSTPNAKLAFPGSAPAAKVVTPQALPKPFTSPGDIFAGKTPPQSTPIKQPEIAVEKTVPAPGSAIKKTEEVVEAATEKTGEGPAQGENPGSSPPELAVVDDSVYLSALEEEIEHFNSELQQLSGKMKNFDIQVGSEEDKAKMKKSIDGLYEFWKELKETTKGQSAEIHAVVMDLMEAFAWLEDARSRNLQRKIPSYIELKKSEELDPLSARHMSEIEHLEYYIKNQLKQLTSYLEKEWMDHQENYRNEVKKKMAVPPLEEVYKTMHYQLKILHKQKALVEELKEKMAVKKRKPQSFLISTDDPVSIQQNGNRVSELSKLAENLLQLKINKEENSSRTVALEMMKSQLSAISERSRKLTRAKQNALRDALSECDTIKIRPVKTTLASSSFLRSLALEKVAQKTAKLKSQKAPGDEKKTGKISAKVEDSSNATSKPLQKPVQSEEKTGNAMKVEVPRTETVPSERPQIPLTVQSLAEGEVKSPLASLSGIVSSIGMKSEMKPRPQAFPFGGLNFQKSEQGKEPIVFGAAKSEPKQEKAKTTQTFTFGASKLAEPIFGGKPTFGVANLSPAVTITKTDLAKISAAPSVTITPVTIAPATTTTTTTTTTTPASSFTFWSPATTTSSMNLPKMNLQFTGKEQNATIKTTGNLFSVPSTVTQSSASPFSAGMSIFGGGKAPASTFTSSSISLFDAGKTTAEPSSQPSGFAFTQPPDTKAVTPKSGTTATPVKPTSETEDVDVVKIENPVKKPESSSEKSKDSPKATVPSGIFGSPLPVPSPKTAPEVTATPAPSSFTFATSQSSNAGNAFVKSVATTAAATTTTGDSTTPAVVSSTTTPVTTAATTSTTPTTSTSSTFSFSKAFGQTATTTTAATTTTSVFGTPTTTANVFGQVSSTTPTKSIFEGSAKTTPTSNIFGGVSPNTSTGVTFGGSTPAKPIFGQAAATPSTTTGSIFGGSTPTTNAFGQVSTPSTPTAFGQKPDAVSQATNLFGQLFGSGSPSATPTTASNIFSTPKNLFAGGGGGGASTTTASLFGATSSSSIFSPTTSVFGQSTTSSKVFGQAQNSSMSFFGQNICSPFGGGTSVTSNQSTFESGGFSKPIFGQSAFGQTTSNTSIFGGSPNNSSLFGGTSSTTSSNVFQTPTTSTTFGSTTPGPFSGGASSFRENSFGSTAGSPFQKPLGGFGSPPVFGGVPAFGGSPTYGGSPTFGSVPAFGSMSQGTFGQSSSGSTTFENLANQNTIGFGNLAQQSQSQSFGGGFAAPAFENKSAFGGNSFSNWRSK